MTEVQPVRPDQFAEILPLLQEFQDSGMTSEDWRRMLFDLSWSVEEPHRGYVLRDDGRPVGFIGTVFSRRTIGGAKLRFCNLSSWIVLESHRAASLQLVLPILGLRDYTIVNFTASPAAHEVFGRFGFQPLEQRQVLMTSLGRLGEVFPGGGAVLTAPEKIRSRLDVDGQRIFDDMKDTRAAQVALVRGEHTCHVVATRTPWKQSMRLAHVLYASDWKLLWSQPGAVSRALATTLGTVGLRIDERHVQSFGNPPPFAAVRELDNPLLYRPASSAVTPTDVDGLYSELVQKPW